MSQIISAEPRLTHPHILNFVGDWGQANFHRICGWLTQEFCTRAGPGSRCATWSIRDDGICAVDMIQSGEADLAIATPAMLMPLALQGKGMFASRPAPNLRALAVLPQDDCMVLALDPALGISSYAELREKRPALRLATSRNDGTNFIGYVANLFLEAHGLDAATLKDWGGEMIYDVRPDASLNRLASGQANAVLQEAIMTPWWADLIEAGKAIPIDAEEQALAGLRQAYGFGRNDRPAGYWRGIDRPIAALDFADFLILVRDDMPGDIAYLLTWCLVETRAAIERQFRHLPPRRSPLSYPLVPEHMAATSIPLHPAARRYYQDTGIAVGAPSDC
jgi:TRAP-type uncharacterized transport system substrate-binding protein